MRQARAHITYAFRDGIVAAAQAVEMPDEFQSHGLLAKKSRRIDG